jgi:branched-chain amino acid transport system ATP-binding protein
MVELARALAPTPKLLLLDEPAAGLAPDAVVHLASLIDKLRADRVTVVLVEHVLSLVMSSCDRVTVLDKGKVIADGRPQEVSGNANVRRAYLGEE